MWQTTSPKTVILQVINLLPSFLIHIVISECSDVHQCIQVLNTLSLFPNGAPPSFVSCSTLTVDKQTCSCGYCIVLVLHHVVPLELTKLCPCKLWLLASSHRGTSEILYLLKCMFPLSLKLHLMVGVSVMVSSTPQLAFIVLHRLLMIHLTCWRESIWHTKCMKAFKPVAVQVLY